MKLRTPKRMTVLVALAAAVVLPGCAQQGPSLALMTGSIGQVLPTMGAGPKSERIGSALYRVRADDRRFKDDQARNTYTLLRAAEVAKAAGGTHFVVVNARSSNGAYIRVLTLEDGTPMPAGAVSADEIIQSFGPQFERKST